MQFGLPTDLYTWNDHANDDVTTEWNKERSGPKDIR